MAPLSGLLAIALLLGGLMVLVLDLGRPDRLIVAMTYYNFKSIFAWNIILYTGFMAIVLVYLWTMMERQDERLYRRPLGPSPSSGVCILTTGTGSIFGFLVAREAYDAAIMAPMFIIMSFSFGLAIFLLVLMAAYALDRPRPGRCHAVPPEEPARCLRRRRVYFVLVFHLTNLYAPGHTASSAFILLDGGIYTKLFWIGHILLGVLLPLGDAVPPAFGKSRRRIAWASTLVIVGGLIQMYVIIIGGQAFPLNLFPGMTSSVSFNDGASGLRTVIRRACPESCSASPASPSRCCWLPWPSRCCASCRNRWPTTVAPARQRQD